MDFSKGAASRSGRGRARLLGGLQLTSLVDVIFLLLIFFLLTTSYTPPEARLNPALQAERVTGGRSADLEPQVVTIEPAGDRVAFRIGERMLRTQAELAELLADLPKESGVFVRPMPGVQARHIAAGLQAAYDAGFTRVTYVPGDGR